MNYYGPRELCDKDGKSTGRWHYTCQNDGKVWPVGYCAHVKTLEPDGTVTTIGPCEGHATPEEACEHQKQYYLDQAEYRLETEEARQRATVLNKCEVCGHFSASYAAWGPGKMRVHYLCNEHCNRETLATLITVGEAASSC